MKSQILSAIQNIEIYPIISFSIFGLFFVTLLFYAFTMRKTTVEAVKQIPLD